MSKETDPDLVKDIRSAVSFRSAGKRSSDEGVEMPVRREFNLNSYKWVDKYKVGGHVNLLDNNTVPKLILTERQPIKKVNWAKVLSDLGALGETKLINSVIKTLSLGANVASQNIGKVYLNHLTDYYSSSVSNAKELLDISDLRKLIGGSIINTYEIPFFNSSYLASSTKDGWEMGSAVDSLGQLGSVINDGFKSNSIMTPQWSLNTSGGMNWEVDYFLINDTINDLANNFTFINALFPSTQWVRMKHRDIDAKQIPTDAGQSASNAVTAGFNTSLQFASDHTNLSFIKSPNIFEVECPGRFKQLFVALDIEVEFVGNVRKMPLHNIMKGISMVNENTLYPDAYKIRITANDLTPPCYNVYANYLMGNDDVTTVPVENVSFKDQVSNKFKSVKQSTKDSFNRIAR